jgi:hypothetical protein
MKTIQTQIPKGYEIDKDKSTFELIVLKKTQKALPMSWEELERVNGALIGPNSFIFPTIVRPTNAVNKNMFPTRELAEASLALAQLLQLRDRWNEDWEADWYDEKSTKFVIIPCKNEVTPTFTLTCSRVMVFKTRELRDLFLITFKNLLEIAKPLL